MNEGVRWHFFAELGLPCQRSPWSLMWLHSLGNLLYRRYKILWNKCLTVWEHSEHFCKVMPVIQLFTGMEYEMYGAMDLSVSWDFIQWPIWLCYFKKKKKSRNHIAGVKRLCITSSNPVFRDTQLHANSHLKACACLKSKSTHKTWSSVIE